ncbi:MAG: hypothetical protein ACE10E_08650, partial [Acidiferrobacterales bacterium]
SPKILRLARPDTSAILECLLAILAIESGDYRDYASVAEIWQPEKVGPFPSNLLMIEVTLRSVQAPIGLI